MTATAQSRPLEVMRPGHSACPGCGVAMGMRMVLQALGHRAVVVVIPSCVAVMSGPFPHATFKVPMFHSAFEIAAPTAAGIARALKIQGKEDIPVLAFAGDGGTFDIGLQSLSGAADRDENIIYVCLDNEAYMNTGIQVSSATPRFAWTGTSPRGNTRRKKQIMEIMAAHRIPYAATACIGFPEDLMEKVKAGERDPRHPLPPSPLPLPHGMEDRGAHVPEGGGGCGGDQHLPSLRDGGRSGLTITHVSRGLPVETYLSLQGRYKHLSEDIQAIQAETDRKWADLRDKAAGSQKRCLERG